jgi:formylglycine-generating enzyme required for sulfatase activity
MGSAAGQDNERPVHRVWVDSFLLAARQVANADFGTYLAAAGATAPPFWSEPNLNHPQQPVVGVSWYEAEKYCQWLRAQTGHNYRLPTEAEWERAARGGLEGAQFPWGDQPAQSRPDYDRRWNNGPQVGGTAPPNSYGLYDISENVHEWCSDWFHADYYSISPERNPKGPESGERRASRGGSWRHQIKISRCAARSSIPPAFQYADYGFRVACDAAV